MKLIAAIVLLSRTVRIARYYRGKKQRNKNWLELIPISIRHRARCFVKSDDRILKIKILQTNLFRFVFVFFLKKRASFCMFYIYNQKVYYDCMRGHSESIYINEHTYTYTRYTNAKHMHYAIHNMWYKKCIYCIVLLLVGPINLHSLMDDRQMHCCTTVVCVLLQNNINGSAIFSACYGIRLT